MVLIVATIWRFNCTEKLCKTYHKAWFIYTRELTYKYQVFPYQPAWYIAIRNFIILTKNREMGYNINWRNVASKYNKSVGKGKYQMKGNINICVLYIYMFINHGTFHVQRSLVLIACKSIFINWYFLMN